MNRKIGAHVSASGGLDKAIERAHTIGANCAQIFSASPQVWKRNDLAKFDFEKMLSKREELHVEPIFVHSLYLINLASDKSDLLRKSFDALQYDLQFSSLLKGSGIVVHLGSHQGRGFEAVREQVAEQIMELLKSTPEDSIFLIENSAGQKGKLCSDLSEIRWLFDKVAELFKSEKLQITDTDSEISKPGKIESGVNTFSSRLGWCFDTCHAHAAGYSLGKSQDSLISKSAIDEITRLDLWQNLKCIHVNDSRDAFDSAKDRHENLGKGNIPQEDLAYFVKYEKVIDIPLILEVPGFEKTGPDAMNIKKLQDFCS